MSNAYQDIAVVSLKLMAVYFAIGIVSSFTLFVLIITQQENQQVVITTIVQQVLNIAIVLGLWFGSAPIARMITKNAGNISVEGNVINGICLTLVVTGGFLIFSKSFPFYASGDLTKLIIAFALTGLAAIMIFLPRLILRGTLTLKGSNNE